MMGFPNVLLVDCFLRYRGEVLLVRRKKSEEWFPGYYGSLWREVPFNTNPYQALVSLFSELGVEREKVTLKAIASNVFEDLRQTFNVLLFFVELKEKPVLTSVPEGDELVWVKEEELLKKESLLEEYKRVFPRFENDNVLFYRTHYDGSKMLDFEILN